MNKNVSTLKGFIKKKLVKDVSFDIESNISKQISLTDKEYNEVRRESEKYDLSKSDLNKLIKEVSDNLSLAPKIEELYKVIPTELKLGQHIKLYTTDEKGEAIEELIYMGESKFTLISHERGALLPNDELKTITSPWNVEGLIDFEVYRDNKRVIEGKDFSIYRTRRIKKIQLLTPQVSDD